MISQRPPWRFVPSRHIPPEIVWGERLLYASVMVWAVRLVMVHGATFRLWTLLLSCVLLLIQVALICAAIRGRNYRACWWLVGFLVACAFFDLARHAIESSVPGWRPLHTIYGLARLIQIGLDCLGFFLIFSKRGRRWLASGARAAHVHEAAANMANGVPIRSPAAAQAGAPTTQASAAAPDSASHPA